MPKRPKRNASSGEGPLPSHQARTEAVSGSPSPKPAGPASPPAGLDALRTITIDVTQGGAIIASPPAPSLKPSAAHAVASVPTPTSQGPRSAWIVFGSEVSYRSDADLIHFGGEGEWTATGNVEQGDLLFFYFIAPYKAIHFVARAVSSPEFGEEYNGRPQWWVEYDSMTRIEPITHAGMCSMFQERRFLPYFNGAKYLRPDHANCLLDRARVAFAVSEACRRNAMQRVVGKRELGDPRTITLSALRQLRSDAFRYEEDVEYHFLEPLLRLAQLDGQARLQRRFDLAGNRTADYAVVDGTKKVHFIIEVKRELPKTNDWAGCPAYKQVEAYAKSAKAPGFALVDRDRLFCFRSGEQSPGLTVSRGSLDETALSAFSAQVLGK